MTINTKSEQRSFNGQQGVYTHLAESTQCEMEFSVYVPDNSDNQHFPVLYYLSGLTCTQENVTTKGGFQQYASQHGIIIVCPDTSPRGTDYDGEHDSYDFGSGAGFYLNATQAPWSTTYQMYDYVVKELPQLIEKHFPVNHEQCGIFGHSMGGHGALTIGLKHPEQFRSISVFAPIVAPMQCPWGHKAFEGYLGSDRENWKNYDATQLIIEGYKSPNEILIDQGTSDNFLQEQLKPEIFVKACEEHGQAVKLRMQQGYDHSYYLMNTFMQDHIEFHASNLK
ncbi:S-formylglutathione hydrolase [Aliikangiella sp. IMCC44359]|uniref:S-formylglutathione hydrolase n=1 Tax=Aliikangiella sp. IMCC44359 TaxID=3459125 RepID=UPI00403B3301